MGIFAATGVDYAISLVIVLMTVAGTTMIARALRVEAPMAITITLTSFVFAYAKYLNTLVDGSDSMAYYLESFGRVDAAIGTDAVTMLTSLFTQGLGLAFLPTNIVFGAAGAFASLLLYASWVRSSAMRPTLLEKAVFFGIVVVAVGFWGGGISKDALALLASSLFCLGLTGPRPMVAQVAAGVALMVAVRPHVGAAMLIGLAAGVPLAKNLPLRTRAPLLALSVVSLVALVPFVLWYVGLDKGAGLAELQTNVEDRTTNFAGSTGFVDLSALPLPLRVLSYLFRPLPYEAASVTQLLASGQNLLLLAVLAVLFWSALRAGPHFRNFAPLALLLFALAALVPLASGTSNLGISMRQKWMFVPALLLALVQLRSFALVRRKSRELSDEFVSA